MKISFTRYDALGIALVATVALLGMDPAFAAGTGTGPATGQVAGFTNTSGAGAAGAGFASGIRGIIQGNLGLAAGIAFAALGAYLWLVKQETGAGIGAIIFGALLALVPNIMDTIYNNITNPIITSVQSGTGQ